ncbi:MAG TPA: DUF397 domain-containing protein [Streptosporangiaceae bacterium]|nr:DUF397 domain-containing protein [Streptosporangiaceae bacterium]
MKWVKSSYSSNEGDCVEISPIPDGMAVRDSKDPDGPILRFSADAWRAFVREVKAGRREVR